MTAFAILAVAAIVTAADGKHVVPEDEIFAHVLASAQVNDVRDSEAAEPFCVDAARTAAALSDAEIADLAARAEALQRDPVAGASAPRIILISLGVILVVVYLLDTHQN